jgi:hypothetical protein
MQIPRSTEGIRMTNAVRCVCLIVVLGVSCVEQTPSPPSSGGAALTTRPSRARKGDLTIDVSAAAPAVTFGHREIAEDSCEIYEGCALGAGSRALMQIQVTVRNIGRAAIDLGHPWENPIFNPSLCQQTNTIFGFISAELRNVDQQLVASGSLSSNCIADRTGGYTCMAQGLGVQGASAQPESQCDYLDVTGLPAGDYHLRLTVNPAGEIPESDRSNNSVELIVNYPACAGVLCDGVCCPDGVECRNGACLLPDLRINAQSAAESLWLSHQTFGAESCELEEQCITGSGQRRLLNFEGRIENWGPGDLSPGPERNNPLFEYSECHDHYHFRDFTDYRLLAQDGSVIAQGHKQSFCLVDMEPVDSSPAPSPPGTRPTPEPTGEVHVERVGEEPEGCNYLSAGMADIYGVGTPCQWVDVTDVPEGDYVLQLSVNPLGRVAEVSLENNTVQIPVHVPADVPCEPEPEICGDAIDQDCDEQPDTWDEDCWQGCFPGDPFCTPPTEVSGNDACESAFELVTQGSYAGSLEEGSGGLAACGGTGAAAFFRFELGSEQAVYLGAIGSSIDTVIALYRGDCTAEPIHCADDDCSGRSGHFVEILPAGTYIAAVKAKRDDTAGRYQFKFESAAAQGARIITRPGVYAADTTTSGDDVQACSDFFENGTGDGPDDVYVLARCNAPVTVSTCGTTTFHSVLESRMLQSSEFGSATQCSAAGSSECQADPLGATLTAYSRQSGLMFLTVDGIRADDAGEYQISISY